MPQLDVAAPSEPLSPGRSSPPNHRARRGCGCGPGDPTAVAPGVARRHVQLPRCLATSQSHARRATSTAASSSAKPLTWWSLLDHGHRLQAVSRLDGASRRLRFNCAECPGVSSCCLQRISTPHTVCRGRGGPSSLHCSTWMIHWKLCPRASSWTLFAVPPIQLAARYIWHNENIT